jgi:G patch domain-containing protein 1
VGSKEGWTPSTFVSSRQSRQKDGTIAAQQKPEDFMDEEDLREAEDARGLATSENFAGFGLTEHDSVRTTGLIDILRPTGETIARD